MKEKAGVWDWKKELDTNEFMSPIQRDIITGLHTSRVPPFHLDPSFVAKYSATPPNFGYAPLGELTYLTKYSRTKPDGSNERWFETVGRVVEGTYNMQKRWIRSQGLNWSDHKAQESAQEMYDRIFKMKFTPPGRGLWAMGSPITEERGLYAALNNCAFVSTDDIDKDPAKPFTFLMDMSMVGIGVGFDTRGAGKVVVKGPDYRRPTEYFDVPDTREGWVESVRRQLESHFLGIAPMSFGYGLLRDKDSPIRGFGGMSAGAHHLQQLHESLDRVLKEHQGKPLGITGIVDVDNLIGRCVVSGNVRRSAEIAFGDPRSEEFLDLKNYGLHPERKDHGGMSNNSVFAELGMDYEEIAKRIRINGEPGIAWLENMQDFGRMVDPRNRRDHRARGGNPCLEQTLEPWELCTLVETFIGRHDSLDDYMRTLKFAYMYAKTVTLGMTHWEETNRVLLRNRRIGCSVSGIAQGIASMGVGKVKEWLEKGYDTVQHYDGVYSDWMVVPRSVKTTSIKPSGTVSLLPGSTPGAHSPISEYYIRRIRLSATSPFIPPLKEAGYKIEPDVKEKDHTLVVEIPIHAGDGVRSEDDISMWEQLSVARFLQRYWADNQVSMTIKFDPETEGHDLARALDHFQYDLKGISFLPKDKDVYQQMPYEAITADQYRAIRASLKPVDFSNVTVQAEGEKFCTNDTCELPSPPVVDANP